MNDNKLFLVSLIVPVYNVEAYLSKCVQSLINQSYKNIEIILVDDGSPDNCPQICDLFSREDERVKVIHKKNIGLSDARNAGIDIASGEYLFFVDSDDFLHPDTIKDLMMLAVKFNADIVECGVETINVGKEVKWKSHDKLTYKIYSHEEAIYRVLDYNNCLIVAWNKLYRKKMFETIRYPVGKIHEDEFTTPYLADIAQLYIVTKNKYYAYVKRENSIMNTAFCIKRLDIIEAFENRLIYFRKKYHGKYDAVIRYHYFVACVQLKRLAKSDTKKSYRIYKERVKDIQIRLFYELLKSKKIDNKRKMQILLYNLVPELAVKLRKKEL